MGPLSRLRVLKYLGTAVLRNSALAPAEPRSKPRPRDGSEALNTTGIAAAVADTRLRALRAGRSVAI